MHTRRLALAAALFPLVLAACALGPSFAVSEDPAPSASTGPSAAIADPADAALPPPPDGRPSRPVPEDASHRSSTTEPPDTGRASDSAVEAGFDSSVVVPAPDSGVDVASPVVVARPPVVGDLVISEIMFDPAGAEPEGEWIEVANVSSDPVELRGVIVRDGAARSHTIGASAVVAPGAFAILARSTAACVLAGVPASSVIYDYGRGLSAQAGVILANGSSGAILLERGGVTLARVPYGSFGLASSSGQSLQARVVVHESISAAASFCASSMPTPGAAPSCP